MTADQYLEFAAKARREAVEYRVSAETANEFWRGKHLRSAADRDEHADFYESRAEQLLTKKEAA